MSEQQEMTFAQAFGGSRDMCCIAAVGDMAEMGRFDEEFCMYGCAYLENNQITYRISPVAEQIYRFTEEGIYQEHYPTRVYIYQKSLAVPAGMKEKIERGVKLKLARVLQRTYPASFYHLLNEFGQLPAVDQGRSILEELKDSTEGHFNELECQLLEGTVQIAYEAKQLKMDSVVYMKQWLEKTRKQMEDTPVIQRGLSRTFYGFCYQLKNGDIKTVVNAQAVPIWEQHSKMKREGIIAGPVLHQEKWFGNTGEISEGRAEFRKTVQEIQNERYFTLLCALKALKSVVDVEQFKKTLALLGETGCKEAIEDFRGYGYRWNCL